MHLKYEILECKHRMVFVGEVQRIVCDIGRNIHIFWTTSLQVCGSRLVEEDGGKKENFKSYNKN